ncbi:response regulator transcription factor, partial [Campylobacter jejuni]|nr:response regulator transcription factor [Campylobacter jejuni]
MLKFKILIIEDDIDLNELLVLKLKSSGYEVISLVDFFGVEDLLDNEQIDLLIVDRNLPSGDSLEKIQDLREQG